MTPQQLQDVLKSGKYLYLLDVREPSELEQARMRGVELHHIPLGELLDRYTEIPADAEVIAICRSGARSAQACQYLMSKGYKATNLEGGMLAWAAEIDPELEIN